jgi:hypothetical protein
MAVILPEDVNAPIASKENPYEQYHLLEKAWDVASGEANSNTDLRVT